MCKETWETVDHIKKCPEVREEERAVEGSLTMMEVENSGWGRLYNKDRLDKKEEGEINAAN